MLQVSDAHEMGALAARTDSQAVTLRRVAKLSSRDGVLLSEPLDLSGVSYAEVAMVARSTTQRRPVVRAGAFAFAALSDGAPRPFVDELLKLVPRFCQAAAAGNDLVDAAFGLLRAFFYDSHIDLADADTSPAVLEESLRALRAMMLEVGRSVGVDPSPFVLAIATRTQFTVLSHGLPGVVHLSGWGSAPRIATRSIPAPFAVLARGVVVGDELPEDVSSTPIALEHFCVTASGFRRPLAITPAA